MKIRVDTPTPQFLNDMLDIVRIFFGNTETDPGAPVILSHAEEVCEGQRRVRVTLTKDRVFDSESVSPVFQDPLEEKRMHKRQLKRCVYDVCRQATGITPPWGSLTGIRPTRLFRMERMRGASMDEAQRALESVFDVSGEKSSLVRETVSVQDSLPSQAAGEIDLYVSVPFCLSRCAYCSFLSGEVGSGRLLAPYTEALCREIAAVHALIKQEHLSPRAFYMGGGTPTALPAPLLSRVLDSLDPLLEGAAEITVEAGRPDTIDREKLALMRRHRVERISINPQTMHDETLARIGRRHTRADTEQAYALAREYGFDHINMDLIAGLPGENADMFRQTLAWSRLLSPESMTVHTLCIKHASLLHLWEHQLPDGEGVAEMVRCGRMEAAARGMRPYYLYRQKYMAGNLENVGYSLPGKENLYNIGMMEENANVLAMGAGGISKKVNTRTGKILRAPNVSNVEEYIARTDEMIRRKEEMLAEFIG